ncbi:MAG: hypothetical protein ABIJ21_02900 [Nanoarchaeota archaeon]
MTVVLRAYALAFSDLKYSLEDFQVPLIAFPKEETSALRKEALADRLATRLSDLHRFRSFETIVFSELPVIHQKRLDEIKYLKRQLVLRELETELAGAEKIFQAMSQSAIDPKIKELVARRIQDLKNKIMT